MMNRLNIADVMQDRCPVLLKLDNVMNSIGRQGNTNLAGFPSAELVPDCPRSQESPNLPHDELFQASLNVKHVALKSVH